MITISSQSHDHQSSSPEWEVLNDTEILDLCINEDLCQRKGIDPEVVRDMFEMIPKRFGGLPKAAYREGVLGLGAQYMLPCYGMNEFTNEQIDFFWSKLTPEIPTKSKKPDPESLKEWATQKAKETISEMSFPLKADVFFSQEEGVCILFFIEEDKLSAEKINELDKKITIN